jgi:hypothetical protein
MVTSGSTDPNVFMGGSYQRDMNLDWFLQVANHDNSYRFDRYRFDVQTWANNGMQGTPPPPPKYEMVDVKSFDTWWTQYCANPGQDAPPTNFFVNGPKNPGEYGWTWA